MQAEFEAFKLEVREQTKMKEQADFEKQQLQERAMEELEKSLEMKQLADKQIEGHTAALKSSINMPPSGDHCWDQAGSHNSTPVSCNHTRRHDEVVREMRCSPNVFHSATRLTDPRWESHLRQHFTEVVDVLQLDSILDRLYSVRLITNDEFRSLLSISQKSNKDAVRLLLLNILPFKGPGTFEEFCRVLQEDETATRQGVTDMISGSARR